MEVTAFQLTPDLEHMEAQQVLEYAVDRFHPRLVVACSFQKEETVLIDMLMRIEPSARVFTIDTGVLFPETYQVWREVEDRYGLHVEVMDATPPNGTPWSAGNCCGTRKVDALEAALLGVDASGRSSGCWPAARIARSGRERSRDIWQASRSRDELACVVAFAAWP